MIEIRHLRYFIAVAEELNFRRASERVHIDQTPLSRAARELEDHLGVQLLIRGNRRLRLTPAGSKMLFEAKRLMLRIERVKHVVRMTHVLYKSPLRVGIADELAQPRLYRCLSSWRDVAPEIPLELTELRAREMPAALASEAIDVGFSFGITDGQEIIQLPAWSYPLMAVLPLDHELASCQMVSLSDLLAFPYLSWSVEGFPGLASQLGCFVQDHSISPMLAGEAGTVSGFVARLASGAGVGLIDSGHIETLRLNNAVCMPLTNQMDVTTFVAFKARRFASENPLKSFLTHIENLS